MDIGQLLRFAWHLDGKIAGSARPGRYGDLERDLNFLRAQGIRHLLNLTEHALEVPASLHDCFQFHQVPLLDGHAPSPQEMDAIRSTVRAALTKGEPILIHCRGGVGRTATVIGALLMEFQHLNLEECLQNLRQAGRFTESMEQWEFLRRTAGE